MGMTNWFKGGAVAATLVVAAGAADAATYTYVGSWQVDQGPSWTVSPEAYTGQEAAALLFGGTAIDYAISTISMLVADIDFQSWVSVWGAGGFPECGGFPCGSKVAQDFETSTGGFYLNPGDTSAFVTDWAVGSEFTNYAFKVANVPLPAALPLLVLALGGLGGVGALRRRKAV